MNTLRIATANDVYQVVERLKTACQEQGAGDLFKQLVDAMNLGSSALEILGAIRQVVLKNQREVEQLLGQGGKEDVNDVVAFVDRAFGR